MRKLADSTAADQQPTQDDVSFFMAISRLFSGLFFHPAPVILQRTFPQYKKLPVNISGSLGINAFLDLKDIAALIGSKEQHQLFQPELDGLKLLRFVVGGQQDEADALLTRHPELLLKRVTITDYSGRTFKNITAYEYAYWAKDTHMCRMLERHMNANTASIIHQRCLDIDKHGLTYEQGGVVIESSCHFDLTQLKLALQHCVDEYRHSINLDAVKAAWIAIGMAQREVPVHVVNEYCRMRDSLFQPREAFNQETLPRNLKFYNYHTQAEESWFPLVISATSGLGVNFALACIGDRLQARMRMGPGNHPLACNLNAVSCLDEVRTSDLTQSRENLSLIAERLAPGV